MIDARSDAEILEAIPDFVSIPEMLKATPREEGGERYLFLEASNEDPDHQGEVVLQKALEDSASYFLRHGNIDISHYTILGPRLGIPNYMDYEIGRPVEVRRAGQGTFVKSQLYRGTSKMAEMANSVWSSITKQSPPARWYPSVGGATLAKSVRVDPDTQSRVGVIERVRWNNIALDRCPVSRTVGEVSTAPIGVFTKALGGFILKAEAMTAGYGTDSADLSGGAALREQSLDRKVKSYWDFRNKAAAAIRERKVSGRAGDLVAYSTKEFSLSHGEAAEYVERFLHDVKTALQQRKAS